MRRRAVLSAVLSLLAVLAAGAADTVTLPVRHRPAAELAPLVRPLAGPDGAVVPAGDALVVRAAPEHLGAVRQALAALDRPPRRLRITLRTVAAGGTEAADVTAGVRAGTGGGRATVRAYATRYRETARRGQSVVALEGHWARIATGALLPYLERSVTVAPGGITTTESVTHRPVLTGLLARARLAPDGTVTVELRAASERERDGAVLEAAGLETVVRGRPGEWIPLGGTAGRDGRRGGRLLGATRDARATALTWQLRVDVLDGDGAPSP